MRNLGMILEPIQILIFLSAVGDTTPVGAKRDFDIAHRIHSVGGVVGVELDPGGKSVGKAGGEIRWWEMRNGGGGW